MNRFIDIPVVDNLVEGIVAVVVEDIHLITNNQEELSICTRKDRKILKTYRQQPCLLEGKNYNRQNYRCKHYVEVAVVVVVVVYLDRYLLEIDSYSMKKR